MSLPKELFKLVFPDIAGLPRIPYPLHDDTILVPTAANALYQGEFLSPFINQGKMTRNPAGPNNPKAYPVFDVRGDYYVQFTKLVSMIMGGHWQALTWVYDATPGTINALGQKLAADLQAFDGANRSVLTAAAGTDETCAIVLELPGSTGAPLKILSEY